ncbi:Uncharacterised protein [Mycobacteroides abscessus subsp. abscessus]|nr:Uncharacterised protein [Mycobacteroides abscessus subsp. abscessus]
MLHPGQCRVVRGHRIFACPACLLISSQKEYAVIDSGSQHDHRQQRRREDRHTDHLVLAEECHDRPPHTQARSRDQQRQGDSDR